MKLTSLFNRIIALKIGTVFISLALLACSTPSLKPTSLPNTSSTKGTWTVPADVITVKNTGRVQPTGKVEIVEFFWYSCSHCLALEPQFAAWESQQNEHIKVVRLPVSWRADMLEQQKLFFSLQQLNRLDLHAQAFADTAKSHEKMSSAQGILQWAQAQGIAPKKWQSVYNSPNTLSLIEQAQLAFRRFELNAVPSLVVNGRYRIIPTAQALQTLDDLVKHELQSNP